MTQKTFIFPILLSFLCLFLSLGAYAQQNKEKLASEVIRKSPEVTAAKRAVEYAIRKRLGPDMAPFYVLGKFAIDRKLAYRYKFVRGEYDFKKEQVLVQIRIDF